jgi:hypothetical protein
MLQKNQLKSVLIAVMVCLALGGYLLHARRHLPGPGEWQNLVPLVSGLLSVLVIPWLFLSRKTLHWGYVLNGMTVIVGTITMAHFSLSSLPGKPDLRTVLFGTTLADIVLLWAKFFAGRALFLFEFYSPDAVYKPGIKTFRYPHMGWWLVHLVLLSLAYWAGNQLWR